MRTLLNKIANKIANKIRSIVDVKSNGYDESACESKCAEECGSASVIYTFDAVFTPIDGIGKEFTQKLVCSDSIHNILVLDGIPDYSVIIPYNPDTVVASISDCPISELHNPKISNYYVSGTIFINGNEVRIDRRIWPAPTAINANIEKNKSVRSSRKAEEQRHATFVIDISEIIKVRGEPLTHV